MPQSLVYTSCLLGCLLVLGCGGSSDLVPVHGTVTLDGRPVTQGGIIFQPVGVTGAQTAKARIQSDGTFELFTKKAGDGVAAAKCRVSVVSYDESEFEETEAAASAPSLIPVRYGNFASSGIEFDISADTALPLKVELTSEPGNP